MVVLVVAAVALVGCGDEDSDGDTGGGTEGGGSGSGGYDYDDDVTTTAPTFDLSRVMADLDLASINEQLLARPPSMASSVSAFTLSDVTEADILAAADDLCVSSYNPDVTIQWLEDLTFSDVNILLLGPATRLRITAETRCRRPASADEVERYEQGINGFFSRVRVPNTGELPTLSSASPTLCDFLDSRPGGQVLEGALDSVIDSLARRFSGDGAAAAILANVVSYTCPRWIQPVTDFVQKVLGGG